MAKYRLYFLDQGRLVGSEQIDADDDGGAAKIARDRGSGDRIEVWSGDRRVRVVGPAARRL